MTPLAPSDSNDAGLTAPTIQSPADDEQLTTLRPTLTVSNATSSGSGSRSYEFQIADNSGFALVAGRVGTALVYGQPRVPEGADGRTSLTVGAELLPATRYHWRARAIQGTSTGPWSETRRFRTNAQSFKSGNQVFDVLTDATTVADIQSNVGFFTSGDRDPGAKLNERESYLGYTISTLTEGEVSFIARRIKPVPDSSFRGQTKIFTMLDGRTGPLSSNESRVSVDRTHDSGAIRFEFKGAVAQTGGFGWADHQPYFFKIEWRGGTARLRIFIGSSESGTLKVDLSVGYSGTYSPANHVVTLGSLFDDTMRDLRMSRLYIGPHERPVALDSGVEP